MRIVSYTQEQSYIRKDNRMYTKIVLYIHSHLVQTIAWSNFKMAVEITNSWYFGTTTLVKFQSTRRPSYLLNLMDNSNIFQSQAFASLFQ